MIKLLYVLFLFFAVTVDAVPLNLDIHAESALLMNAHTGEILFEKNAHTPQYPASITKIATALFTLHVYGDKLHTLVKAEHDAVASVTKESKKRANYTLPAHWLEPGATHMGIKKDELLSLRDLLSGMLISSASDASNVIAQYIGGTIPNFMHDLNNYLKEIGCRNTSFCNPHGLHHPKHKTTAYDMALIARQAMKYAELRDIVKMVTYTRPKTNKQSPATMIQTNRLLRKGNSYYDKAIGIKTGWTTDAMHTLVACAESEGRMLIAVLIKVKERETIYEEAKLLFKTAFNQPLVQRVLLKAGPQKYALKHPHSSKTIHTYLEKDVCIDFYPAEEPLLKCTLKWLPIEMPVKKGKHVGDMLISNQEGRLIQKVPLYALEDVNKSWLHGFDGLIHSDEQSEQKTAAAPPTPYNKLWKTGGLTAAFFLLAATLLCMRKRQS